MIQVNKITPQTVEFFTPEGKSLGFLNQYEFYDLRVQCKEQKISGYYCICHTEFPNEKCVIDSGGRVDNWPKGFFDLWESQLIKLI